MLSVYVWEAKPFFFTSINVITLRDDRHTFPLDQLQGRPLYKRMVLAASPFYILPSRQLQ